MDLFRVERFLADNENEPDQRDESKRLAELQSAIADRKRKRLMLAQGGGSYEESNKIQFSDSKQMKSDVQEEVKSAKKAKKKKTKTEEEKSEKVQDKGIPKEKGEVKNAFSIDDSQEMLIEKNSEKINYKRISKKGLKEEKVEVKNDIPMEDSQEDRLSKTTRTKGAKKGNNKTIFNDKIIKSDFDNEDEDISQENEDSTEKISVETLQENNEDTGFTVIGGQKKNKECKKVQRVLPGWLAKPTIINSDLGSNKTPVDKIPFLESHIITKLQQLGIHHLFPVQSVVIPAILSQMDTKSFLGKGGYAPGDICVSAPTGSGKTLAYVIPIVQILMKRVVCHLRALIILPTKDLANQVKQVFEMFTEGTNLSVGLASGSNSFTKNQEQLANQDSCGSSSRIDILVCTPGRLVDHISSTPNFTLHHVRFLVIDEADRMLSQSYHGWLGKVLKAAYNKQSLTSNFFNSDRPLSCTLQTIRHPAGAQTAASFATIQLPLQKLLFSATMTHSPEKLAPLQLYQPTLFTGTGSVNQTKTTDLGKPTSDVPISGRFSVPEGLSEYMTVCNSGEKPLMVLYFLTQLKFERVLCFASTLEATHRLYLLMKLYGGIEVAEYSSSLSPPQRKGILRDFRLGKLQLLICSDAMARGMDIQDVCYVISYDVPNYVRTYIHRVGRTARAGNKGTAITLLHSEEVHHFKEVIQKTGREKIAKYNIKEDKLQPMVEQYQDTLERLQEAVQTENQKKTQQKGKRDVVKLLAEQFMTNVKK